MDTRYDCLEQRMVQTYLDTFPPFVPSEAGPSEAEQEQFYRLMEGLYRLLLAEPNLIVRDLHEDDAFPNRFNRASYGKPKLMDHMRKATKAVDALLETMVRMATEPGAVKVSARQRAILERLGVGHSGALPVAWTWMATRPGSSLLSFSRCLFKDGYPYASAVYARLLGDENAFARLENWLIARGYTRYDYLDGKMSLEYANPAWDERPPRGGFEYRVRHTGVSLRFDEYAVKPAVLGLCIPKGLKPFLEAFDRMDARVKDFVVSRTKKCDGCGYCTQTDKTGTRPRPSVPIEHEGRRYRFCPYFPGYRYCWAEVGEALVDDLTAMMEFMDSMLETSTA
ncbi:MAG: hypothetical protein ACOYEW_05195 [Anaerolineae bacterium]|jgi:hypothetical protein